MVSRRLVRRLLLTAAVILVAAVATAVAAGHADAWPWDNIGEKAEEATKGIGSRLVNAILYALISLMKYVMTFFTAEKTNIDAGTFSSMIEWAGDYTYQLQSAFLLLSIVYVAGRFAVSQWTGGSTAAVTSGISVSVRALGTSLGAATVVILLTRASDIFAAWIYDDTGDKVTKVTDEVKKKIGTIDSSNFDGSSLLLVVIACIAVLGCLDLLIQLFLRLFYLAFGTALLPVAAASSGTEGGQATYSQITRLIIAMIAFKPICAGAFALAMSYPLGDKSDAADVFIAVLLYVAPILCLPTLLSLVGVGGSIHGRVSGLAGVAALVGGGRAAQRLVGKAGRGVGGLGGFGGGRAGRGGGGGGGGGSRGGPPTGTSPTPPRGPRPSGPGGGSAAVPTRGSGGSGGGPRLATASSTRASAQASSRPADTGTPRHAAAGNSTHGASGHGPSGGAGRHAGGADSSSPATAAPTARSSPTRPDAGSPRSVHPSSGRQGASPAPPRRTVADTRNAGGDRRTSAKNIARRNLGAHYIGRR
jgi:type IV secretion system protein TrbL